jgi:hypothetical protein
MNRPISNAHERYDTLTTAPSHEQDYKKVLDEKEKLRAGAG